MESGAVEKAVFVFGHNVLNQKHVKIRIDFLFS